MNSLRGFWRRHKKKIFVTLGVVGSGYAVYRLYDAHKRRLYELQRQLAHDRENDERIKAQLQEHFESIQRIADSATLPHAMHYLSSRLNEELDLAVLTERLKQGKDTLTLPEKLDLWDRLKVLGFTKMVLSLWSVTLLSLFVRVQVNILGRQLYIDIARSHENSPLIEEANFIDQDDEQNFLARADFLARHGLPALITNMEAAAVEILKTKQLKDTFNSSMLHETIMQILETFMSMGKPHPWVDYLMPEDARFPGLTASSSSNSLTLSDVTKFDQLMTEAQTVLSSDEFTNVVEVSLTTVANAVVKDIFNHPSGAPTGTPLVKLVPRVAQVSQLILDEPSENQFIQLIRNIHDVELFFTILYTNTTAG
ncbi:peroxisome biogenesis protein 3-2 [Silene latifolia]|uniref:peroxisome biogenesis protein 3-2 n=1 Tax=Silene latifolia TaxID=37657 RepID=UPI003D76A932